MKEEEIEAVLGHEVTHIANGDMVTMTLLQGVINAFVMFLARVLASILSGLGGNNRSDRGSYGSYFILTFVFEILFMILGSMVLALFSRYREYRADRGGAMLSSKDKMIGALQTLKNSRIPSEKKRHDSVNALMISSPKKGGFLRFFATHPPLDERIARLKEMP